MKNYLLLLLFFLLVFSACENNSSPNTHNVHLNLDTINSEIQIINEYSNFIAGIYCDSFENVQSKNFYENYEKSITTTWNYFYNNQILLISKWAISNNITSETDTTTVFYPFSGPDFAFLYGFFPYANNYVLVGLENIGVVPNFKEYSDLEIEQYLNSLSNSMTHFFLEGFFSTQTMKNSFRSPNMNGIIHPLLFFINRTGHTITNMNYFTIDEFGKPIFVEKLEPLNKQIKGVKLSFVGDNGKKDLYYLQFNLSNESYVEYPEFATFISNYGHKNVFLKSASYLLQEDFISQFRKLLYNQAIKILQDDSGFSYDFLKKSGFDIALYGNYTRTLNIFENYWQEDLKNAFNSSNISKLPFRFGYNIPFDETALIFANNKQKQQYNYPFYTIQFIMSWNKISTDTISEQLIDIDFYYDEGYYKYVTGAFSTIEEAEIYLLKIKNIGYPDAFILKFDTNGKHLIN